MNSDSLPQDFLWGVASASYQIEGAVNEGGRGESIWDRFARIPGAVHAGESGSVGCDHYHRYEEDLDLIAALGVKAYRFSIAWPRVQPSGEGEPNPEGIAFYHRLLDAMECRGIEPFATLYHWDLPQALEDRGGWAERSTALAFARYAEICYREFGPRIRKWATLNEPWCSAYLGYFKGEHAPGRRDLHATVKAVHHLNLAHGLAVQAFRESGLSGEVGIAWNLVKPRPASSSREDRDLVERLIDRDLRMYTGPVLGKGYPEAFLRDAGLQVPVLPGDLACIGARIDFAGINYYSESLVRANPAMSDGAEYVPMWQEVSAMGWPIVPSGLLRTLEWIAGEAPGLPLYITENGCAMEDTIDPADGRIHDPQRIEYLRRHLEMCARAVAMGIPLKGYFLWSFIDNFEWAYGYSRRFGIVYCDYRDLSRKPKDSYYFYRDVIAGVAD